MKFGTKFQPYPGAAFSMFERSTSDRLVMNRSVGLAECVLDTIRENRIKSEQWEEKRLFCGIFVTVYSSCIIIVWPRLSGCKGM